MTSAKSGAPAGDPAAEGGALAVGDLVVFPAEPALGVGRIERFVDVDGAPSVRVLLYVRVGFVVRPIAAVRPCPPRTPVAPP